MKMRKPGEPITIDNAPWVIVFECGHSRLPDGNALDYGGPKMPPDIGWSGYCLECKDYRKTVEIKTPLAGSTPAASH